MMRGRFAPLPQAGERAPNPVTQTAQFVAYLLTKTREEFATLYEPHLLKQEALLTEIRDLLKVATAPQEADEDGGPKPAPEGQQP